MRDIIRQKIVDSLAFDPPASTRRDVRIPGVPGKVKAIIGPRRAGKTTFLWQVLAQKLESGVSREGLLYFNFEDERLGDLRVDRLHLVVDSRIEGRVSASCERSPKRARSIRGPRSASSR